MVDFPVPVEAFTRMRIPQDFNGRNPQSRRDLASTLRARTQGFTPPPPRGAAGGGRGRARPEARRRAGDQPAARRAAGAPLPRLPRPRGPRPLGRAAPQARAGHPHPAAPHRAAHQHDRPAVRPGLRGADRAGLPRGRRGHRDRRAADADLHRHGPGRRRVAARRAVGRALARASWPRRCPRWSSRPGAPTTPSPPRLPGGRVQAGAGRHGLALGRPRRASSASTSSTSCASPTSASPGRPTGGPRAPASTRCSPRPTSPPATSCAGSSSCSTSPTRSPTPPGDGQLRKTARADRRPRCAAAWSPTPRLRVTRRLDGPASAGRACVEPAAVSC